MPRSKIICVSCRKEIKGTKKGGKLVKINADFHDKVNNRWVKHTLYLHIDCYNEDNERARQQKQDEEFRAYHREVNTVNKEVTDVI